MALRDIIEEKLERLDSVPLAFTTFVERDQERVFREALQLLGELETVGGLIILSETNIATVERIVLQIRGVIFGEEYVAALTTFASQFNIQGGINDQYFVQVLESFTVKDIYKQVLRQSQSIAIASLDLGGIDAAFIPEYKNILNASVSSGADVLQTADSLRTYILGDSRIEGQYTRYVKGVAFDAFAHTDRSYTETIANDLGLDWFRYAGGLIKDSRVFCVERNGKFFHRSEVEGWGAIPQWQGRDRNTNQNTIFTLLGGYNCKHSLLPVSSSAVPKEVQNRIN